MAAAAILAAGLLAAALRQARAAGDLDASTMLTLGIAWLFNLPAAVAVASGEFQRRPDQFRQLVAVLPGWYEAASRLAMVAIAALAGLLLLRRLLMGRAPLHAAGLIAIVLWTVAQLASALHGGEILSLGGFALLACLLAATVLPLGRGACLGAAIFVVTFAIAGGLLAVFRSDLAFTIPCEGACSGLGFKGVFTNDDLAGVTLAAGVPFAYLGFRGRVRFWLTLYLLGMAVATGSRTALAAALVTAAVLLVVRPDLGSATPPPRRAAIAALFVAAAAAAAALLPLHHWNPEALTGRPYLWQVAEHHIAKSPLVGYGPHTWETLADISQIPEATVRSTHNQWLDVLFVSGWIGAALFAAFLIAALASARQAWPGAAILVGAFFTLGAAEGVWRIGMIDYLSYSLVAVILTGSPFRRPASAHGEPRGEPTLRTEP
jgi:O-antigen ligase